MIIVPMTKAYAKELIAWEYPAPYDFYNMNDDSGAILEELLTDDYYAVLLEDALIGFFAYGSACRIPTLERPEVYQAKALDYGLGLSPRYTGKGLGLTFVTLGMAFGKEQYSPQRLRLTVAQFNHRAIKTYRNAGFSKIGTITASTNIVFDVMLTNVL